MIYSIITLCLERHHFQFDVVHLHHAHDIMEPKDAIYDNQAPQPQRNNDKKKSQSYPSILQQSQRKNPGRGEITRDCPQ